MIFISFILTSGILVLSAYFCGGAGLFLNRDSIVIVTICSVFFALSVSAGRFHLLLKGLKEMFSFRKNTEKSREVRNVFAAMTAGTTVIGFLSSAQGITSAVLSGSYNSLPEVFSVASFTFIYGLLVSFLLWLPVAVRNS